MKRFRGWLVFEAHRLVYHSTLGSRVIKKKKKRRPRVWSTSASGDPGGAELCTQRNSSLCLHTYVDNVVKFAHVRCQWLGGAELCGVPAPRHCQLTCASLSTLGSRSADSRERGRPSSVFPLSRKLGMYPLAGPNIDP